MLTRGQPVATAEDAAFMADLLGEVDTNVPSRVPVKTVKNESRRKVRVLSPPVAENRKSRLSKTKAAPDVEPLMNTPPVESNCDDGDDYMGGFDGDDLPTNDPMPSSPIQKAVERKGLGLIKVEEEDDEDDMEVTQAIGDHLVKAASVNISGSRPVPKVLKQPSSYPTPESSSPTRPPTDDVDPSAWNDVTSKLNVLSSPASQSSVPGKLGVKDAIEEDGSIHMFWTDYTEVNGSLCLFGKVKDRSTNSYVSAFVKVDNVLRKLFFLPRVYKQRKHSLVEFQKPLTL